MKVLQKRTDRLMLESEIIDVSIVIFAEIFACKIGFEFIK